MEGDASIESSRREGFGSRSWESRGSEKYKKIDSIRSGFRTAWRVSHGFRQGWSRSTHPWKTIMVITLFFMLMGAIYSSSIGSSSDLRTNASMEILAGTESTGRNTWDGSEGNAGNHGFHSYAYVVVMDAGSTGTRVHLYKALKDEEGAIQVERLPIDGSPGTMDISESLSGRAALGRRGGNHVSHPALTHEDSGRSIPMPKAYHRVETTPGLADILRTARSPSMRRSDVHVALMPLLAWAEKAIPSSFHSRTPVVLLATGGARSLNPPDRKELLEDVDAVLASSSFDAGHGSARIIEGDDEAVLGFVALNFVSSEVGSKTEAAQLSDGGIDWKGSHNATFPLARLDGTIGTVELGGASLQLAIPGDRETKEAHVSEVHLGGNLMRIITKDFEGYGLEASFDRSMSILANEQLGDLSSLSRDAIKGVVHPCIQKGFSGTYVFRMVGERPMQDGEGGEVEVELRGMPDAERCGSLARRCAEMPSNGDLRPASETSLLMPISGFHVIRHFFQVDPYASWSAVEEQAKGYCSMEWKDVTKDSHYTSETHPEKFCFWGRYGFAVLHDSAALDLKEHHLAPTRGDVPWADGAALLEADRLFRREGKTSFFTNTNLGEFGTRMHPATVKIALMALLLSSSFALLVLSSAGVGPAWLNHLLCRPCRENGGNLFEGSGIPLWIRSSTKPKHSRSFSAPGLGLRG